MRFSFAKISKLLLLIETIISFGFINRIQHGLDCFCNDCRRMYNKIKHQAKGKAEEWNNDVTNRIDNTIEKVDEEISDILD